MSERNGINEPIPEPACKACGAISGTLHEPTCPRPNAWMPDPSTDRRFGLRPDADEHDDSAGEPQGDLRERLAAFCHEQWSGWMKYQYERQIMHGVMAWEDEVRWRRQMQMPYADLPETEKESDRKEADRILALLAEVRNA